MQDFQAVAHWVSENYPSAERIVEVGVGEIPQVLVTLREELPDCELVAVDVKRVSVPEGVDFVLDDVTDPDMSVYRGSDLIFSFRAPPELYDSLKDTAIETEADLLVKPISSEEAPRGGRVINYSGLALYLFET